MTKWRLNFSSSSSSVSPEDSNSHAVHVPYTLITDNNVQKYLDHSVLPSCASRLQMQVKMFSLTIFSNIMSQFFINSLQQYRHGTDNRTQVLWVWKRVYRLSQHAVHDVRMQGISKKSRRKIQEQILSCGRFEKPV